MTSLPLNAAFQNRLQRDAGCGVLQVPANLSLAPILQLYSLP